MVSAIELSDSMGVIVLRETGEKSNPVTRSTSLWVAEATRLKVLPVISIVGQHCEKHRLTSRDAWDGISKPAYVGR